MLPCTLVNITNEFTENVTCLRGGKVAIGVKPDWICRKSPALELFSNPHRKPSILAEAYTRLTSELYGQALAPYRDEETSKWGLTLEGESIGYYPSIANVRRVAPLFDITLGYDRQLFDLITDVHLTDYVDQIINNKNQRLTIEQVFEDKVRGLFDFFFSQNLVNKILYLDRAPIFWMNYNCDTPSNRTGYMLELMRYIRVDVYGKCGNPNWDSNKSISNDPKVLAQEKLALVRQYLFTIAIENSFEHDYVTEKLWQPLAAGSVPIYLGAPNIDNWLPCYNYSCIINLRQFSSIRDAANFINKIAQSRSRYVKYHEWRNEESVRPSFIKMVNYFKEANKHSMECLLCDMVYRHDRGAMRRKLLAANNPFNDPFPSLV
jgi:hypothetical protein